MSQEKDAEDDLPDESSAKRRSSKANKKKGGDQKGSARKAAPWATEAKEAGVAAAGVGVETKSWPAPLQTDVQQAATASSMSAAAATAAVKALFMSKFGNLSVGGSGEGDDVFRSMDAECLHASKQGEAASSIVFCRRRVLGLAHFTHTNGEPTNMQSHLFAPCGHLCVCSTCLFLSV